MKNLILKYNKKELQFSNQGIFGTTNPTLTLKSESEDEEFSFYIDKEETQEIFSWLIKHFSANRQEPVPGLKMELFDKINRGLALASVLSQDKEHFTDDVKEAYSAWQELRKMLQLFDDYGLKSMSHAKF